MVVSLLPEERSLLLRRYLEEKRQSDRDQVYHRYLMGERLSDDDLDLIAPVVIRQQCVQTLDQKPWWRATKPSVKAQILALPSGGVNDCNGCLHHLASFPNIVGGVRILRIDELLVPDTNRRYGLMFVAFVQEVTNPENCYNYELFTWRQGPDSGTKGIALIKQGLETTHIAVLWAGKFSIGKETFDAIGGFNNGGLTSFMDEIRQELGMPSLQPASVIPLGRNLPDSGMTPNHPYIGAVVILVDDAKALKEMEESDEILANPDPYELRGKLSLIPMDQIRRFALVCDDSYIGMCLWRLDVQGYLKLPPLESEEGTT